MPLVSYEDSSGEEEIYEPKTSPQLLKNSKLPLKATVKSTKLSKNSPVKITIPSLKDFDTNEEEPDEKKFKSQCNGGLLALIPVPKSRVKSVNMIPNILCKKANSIPISNKNKTSHKAHQMKIGANKKDYFYLKNTRPIEDLGLKTAYHTITNNLKADFQTTTNNLKPEIIPAPEPEKYSPKLNNKAFKEMFNTMKKNQVINIVDKTEEHVAINNNILIIKAVTDPEQAPRSVNEEPVNSVSRRKHHITYLAQKAKAQEQDLQNQWAQSRFNRQQTRAKYGF